jgi:5-methylcytosine-specific restriction endonuclease McrA
VNLGRLRLIMEDELLCESRAARRRHYKRYRRSAHWRRVKARALHRAGHVCERCGRGGYLEVHHLTYRTLGSERARDVRVLCQRCHAREHQR